MKEMQKNNKLKAIVAIAVTLAFILPTSAVFVNDEATFVDTTVSIDPLTQTVDKETAFTVDVYVVPGEPIAGVQFDLFFDETIIHAVSVVFPPGYIFEGHSVMRDIGTIDNVAGKIGYVYCSVTDELPLPEDPGVFVTISFTSLVKSGTSILDLGGIIKVTDYYGDPVPIVVNDGSVTVDVEPIYYTLDITVEGSGTTDPLPGTYSHITGTVVDLEATPDLGWSFDHWVGDVADPSSNITIITMNDNKNIMATFKEEPNNPPTSAVDPLPQWKKTIPFSVTAKAFDDIGIANVTLWYRYSENGAEWTDWTAYGTDEEEPWIWLFTGSDGYYEFYSIAVDDIGSVEDPPDVADASTGIDTTPPFTEIHLNGTMGDNGWYVSVVTVTLNATDNTSGIESTWYRLNGGPRWRLYTKSFLVSKEGYHIVEYYSFDYAGNREDIKEAEVKIDTTPPVTTHKFDGQMGESGWFIGPVTVTFSVHDATSGVNYTMYKIDEGNWTNYNNTAFSITEDGNYNISYYSADLAGHIEEPPNKAPLKIERDLIPPETNHTFEGVKGDNGWYTSNVLVVLTAEDNAAGVEFTFYKIDDNNWTKKKYTDPFTFIVSEDGEHELRYYSVDSVGNNETEKNASFNIDKTSPTIDLTAEGSGKIWLLIADVYDKTSGIAKVEFYVAGECLGNVTESPYEWEYTGASSGETAQAIAYDNAGNLKISTPPTDAVPQNQDMIGWTFLVGWISNVEDAENIITAQAIRLRYIEVAPTGITVGFVKTGAVEFGSRNLLGRTLRSFGRMSLVLGIFKGGITIEGE